MHYNMPECFMLSQLYTWVLIACHGLAWSDLHQRRPIQNLWCKYDVHFIFMLFYPSQTYKDDNRHTVGWQWLVSSQLKFLKYTWQISILFYKRIITRIKMLCDVNTCQVAVSLESLMPPIISSGVPRTPFTAMILSWTPTAWGSDWANWRYKCRLIRRE